MFGTFATFGTFRKFDMFGTFATFGTFRITSMIYNCSSCQVFAMCRRLLRWRVANFYQVTSAGAYAV